MYTLMKLTLLPQKLLPVNNALLLTYLIMKAVLMRNCTILNAKHPSVKLRSCVSLETACETHIPHQIKMYIFTKKVFDCLFWCRM